MDRSFWCGSVHPLFNPSEHDAWRHRQPDQGDEPGSDGTGAALGDGTSDWPGVGDGVGEGVGVALADGVGDGWGDGEAEPAGVGLGEGDGLGDDDGLGDGDGLASLSVPSVAAAGVQPPDGPPS